jgi:hypothetical protein
MIVSLPLNLFTFAAFALGFTYYATHAGSKAHAGWLFSGQTFLVVALVVILVCVGMSPHQIWHLLSGGH